MILHRSSGEVLVEMDHDPLCGYTREGFKEALRKALGQRVLEVWVFGSFAEDRMKKFSDVDIILVAESDKPFNTRAFDFQDLLDIGPEMDILVYTPDEFGKLTKDPSPGFWKSVVGSMIRIL